MNSFLILLGSQLVRALFENQTTFCCPSNHPILNYESIKIISPQEDKCFKVQVSNRRGCSRINRMKCTSYPEASSDKLSYLNMTGGDVFKFTGYAHEYQSYKSMKKQLELLGTRFEIGTFIESIGKTYENRDIFLFKISSGSNLYKKAIWINGAFHANQWISPAVIIKLIEDLLQSGKYKSDSIYLDQFDYYFTPLPNPDGYEYSRSNYCSSVWIYNRVQNRDHSRGVDLEKNWQKYKIFESTDGKKFKKCQKNGFLQNEIKTLGAFKDSIPNQYVNLQVISDGSKIIRDRDWIKKTPRNNNIIENIAGSMVNNLNYFGYNATYQVAKGNEMKVGLKTDGVLSKPKSISYIYSLPLKSDSDDINDAKYYVVQPNEHEFLKYTSDLYNSIRALANYIKENDYEFSSLFN